MPVTSTCTLLRSIADRSLHRYDIWKLGYSPINVNELYIALEKPPRKDIAKEQKDGLR
jgi:hypothetical protein